MIDLFDQKKIRPDSRNECTWLGIRFAKACKSRRHVRCIQPSAFASNIPCDCGNFSGAFRPERTIGRAQTRQAVTARWAAGIRAEAEYVMPTFHRSYVLEEYPAGEVEQ
jgi:hypothetical protein